jgi:two-component sensor histidine kinase
MSGLSILGSMRGRLMMMLAAFAVPLAGMAGVIAFQNYHSVLSQARQSALVVENVAAARHAATMEGVEQVLTVVALAPVTRSTDIVQCNLFLTNILNANHDRYADLAVVTDAGKMKCSGNSAFDRSVQADELFAEMRQTGRFTVRAPTPGRDADGVVVRAAYPILIDGRFSGAVIAGLRLDWLATREVASIGPHTIWILGPDRQPLDGGQRAKAALPTPVALKRLLANGDQVERSQSQNGRTTYYAIEAFNDGTHVLIGYDAEQEFEQARNQLLSRLVDVGLLVIAGLSAIAFCAERALIEPLRRLTQSVGRWRGGGEFNQGLSHQTPREVGELSTAFAHAIGALIEREGQLKGAVAQQELLMQEIHHRVKNNLQIVASLLNLQAARIRQPDAKAEFQAARDRVRTLATLHRHLYTHGDLHTINMRSFLTELCGQLFLAHGETEGDRIALEIDAPELQMSSDQAVPLALLVTEIVSNSVKFAFPPPGRGRIRVRLEVDGQCARLRIEDDGVGIEDVSTGEDGNPHGLGLQLIRGFARQLGATLVIQTRPGMSYQLELALRPGPTADSEARPSGFAVAASKKREVGLPADKKTPQIGVV